MTSTIKKKSTATDGLGEAQVAWAKALGVDPQEFAKKLLSFYDPHTHKALFGKGK